MLVFPMARQNPQSLADSFVKWLNVRLENLNISLDLTSHEANGCPFSLDFLLFCSNAFYPSLEEDLHFHFQISSHFIH